MMLLEQMLLTDRFEEFVCEFMRILTDEQVEKAQWELYTACINNIGFAENFPTFEDFVKANERELLPNATKEDIETTVKHSFEMMENFVPG